MKKLTVLSAVIIIAFCACKHHDNKKGELANRYFQAAYQLDYYNVKDDSAIYFYDRCTNFSEDSLEKGTAFNFRGIIQLEAGDYYSAQESFLASLKTLEEALPSYETIRSSDCNSLANAALQLREYDSAMHYYNLGLKLISTPDYRMHLLNNKAVLYQKMGDYNSAITIFDSITPIPTLDTNLKARIISNAARTKWLKDSNYNALPSLLKALDLRNLMKNDVGIYTSYEHLSDYYKSLNPDSALYYALKRYELSKELPDPSDKLSALYSLTNLIPVTGLRKYVEMYLNLDDSLKIINSLKRNQFALIRSDAEKTRKDNQLLQKRIARKNLLVWGTALFALLLISALIIRTKIRRKKLKQEAENAIRESKLKTSQKIHDVVANGLYGIMNELEHKEKIDKEPLLNKVEQLYEQSRDISYEDAPGNIAGYNRKLHELLTSFANDRTKVILIGNQQNFWNKVTPSQQHELKLVLNEIMVNMQKHSQAKNVVIHFRQENNLATITYKDDGIGFMSDPEFGNGLNNTVNRIKSIKGQVIFEKSDGTGVSITIYFPLEPF